MDIYGEVYHNPPKTQTIPIATITKDMGIVLNTRLIAEDNVISDVNKARWMLFYQKRSSAALIPSIPPCTKRLSSHIPLMNASGLEKSDVGKNQFYSALNMSYPNGKIIGAERIRTFIGYSGWPITLQLPLDTLASLCHCTPRNARSSVS